jgi:elongation factor G
VKEKRNELIECLSNLDKEMEELYLNEQQPTIQQIENCIRKLTLERKFYPVFMGSAYKNKGVQLALEGVVRFLPSPLEKENLGFVMNKKGQEEKVVLEINDSKPFVGYVFKLE